MGLRLIRRHWYSELNLGVNAMTLLKRIVLFAVIVALYVDLLAYLQFF